MTGPIEDQAPLGTDVDDSSDSVPLTVFAPEAGVRGGIVVLHEARTFPDALLAFMKALAADGWLVAAPHLFHRASNENGVFGAALFEDFDATTRWLVANGAYEDCIGVVGFDEAGTAAALVATNRAIGAAVSVAAPGIAEALTEDATSLLDAAPHMKAPWLGLYGRDDARTPVQEVERLQEATATASVATLVVSYAGVEHRADEDRTILTDDAGEDPVVDAERRIFDWFDSHLR